MRTPVLLTILDGWGLAPPSAHNAISQAHTPHWDRWSSTSPMAHLACSGEAVGLPAGQIGNSEVGHMHLGAGQVLPQALTTINHAIEQQHLASHPLMDALCQPDITLHLVGLLSSGGVHSHLAHVLALLEQAHQRGVQRVYIHAFLDGRDTAPKSAAADLLTIQQQLDRFPQAGIASICGRFYAMDRDQRWERTEQAWALLTQRQGRHSTDAHAALQQAYQRGQSDEFVEPTWCLPRTAAIEPNDQVLLFNYRADRMRQITQALLGTTPHISGTSTVKVHTLTPYGANIDVPVLFPQQPLDTTLGSVVAQHGLRQLRVAETEKYAHVTYFINGGREPPLTQEERVLVPSPKVKTYDQQPDMSAHLVTQHLLDAIDTQRYDLIICNYANADMVGHTGDWAATISAVETLDRCLGQLAQALSAHQGHLLITADHGNAEQMIDPHTGQIHTAHTCHPVPLLQVGPPVQWLHQQGSLIDIAPTVLALLGLAIPEVMTGQVLLRPQ